MKKNIQTRLQEVENRAKQKHTTYIQRIIKSMTTEDLRELADENTSKERCNEIWERAEKEYKKMIKRI